MSFKVEQCILLLKDKNKLPKLHTIISDFCISPSELENHYFKEVVSASFTASTFMKSHNPYMHCLIASEQDFTLYKCTMGILLGISIFKFNTITKNYSITSWLEHGSKGIKCNRLGIIVLKSNTISCAQELAE